MVYPYNTHLNRDLKQILRTRGLKVSGNKADMIARLDKNDEDHPFPFFKLPPEIRNKIYYWSSQHPYSRRQSHVPSEDDFAFDDGTLDSFDWDLMVRTNSKMMLQPSLFRSCAMTRREGLPLYYRTCTHIFDRHMNGKDDARITKWLKAITEQGFYVRKLHILITSNLLEDPDNYGIPYKSHHLNDFTRDILSILPQDTTLLFSNYFGHLNPCMNVKLLNLGTDIHHLRLGLSNTKCEEFEPVMQFTEEGLLETVDTEDRQTLRLTEVGQMHTENTRIWQNHPATLQIPSMEEYRLAGTPAFKMEP